METTWIKPSKVVDLCKCWSSTGIQLEIPLCAWRGYCLFSLFASLISSYHSSCQLGQRDHPLTPVKKFVQLYCLLTSTLICHTSVYTLSHHCNCLSLCLNRMRQSLTTLEDTGSQQSSITMLGYPHPLQLTYLCYHPSLCAHGSSGVPLRGSVCKREERERCRSFNTIGTGRLSRQPLLLRRC